MALTNLSPQQPTVEFRRIWGDVWEAYDWLRCEHVSTATYPAGSRASFQWLYGDVHRPGEVASSVGTLEFLRGAYIRVRDDTDITFVGRVYADTDQARGNDVGSYSGAQQFEAIGLEGELDRAPVGGAYWLIGGEAVKVDTVAPFNLRPGRGAKLIGNRSGEKVGGTYVFSEDGFAWTAYDVVEYLLARFAPQTYDWQLVGQVANLDAHVDVWQPGRTVAQTIGRVIQPQRGHGWHVDATSGEPLVTVDCAFETALRIDADRTLEPNNRIRDLDADADTTLRVDVTTSEARKYDACTVRGSAVVLCGTLHTHPDLRNLVAGWSDNAEAAYKLGTDAERSAEELADVYRTFVLGGPDGRYAPCQGAGQWAVAVDDDGGVATSEGAPWVSWGKVLLRQLPLLSGYDYTGSEPSRRLTATRHEHLAPMVFVDTEDDEGNLATYRLDVIDEQIANTPAVHVTTLDTEMGFRVRPPWGHLLAEGHFADATISKRPPAFDWRNLAITCAWESDQRLRVRRIWNEDAAIERRRELILDLPEAECWVLLQDTVLDADGSADIQESGATMVLRNDAERLRTIAALAEAWYGRTRRGVTIRYPDASTGFGVGQLLRKVTIGGRELEVATMVTEVRIDYRRGATRITTDYQELDLAALAAPAGNARGGMLGRPSLAVGPDRETSLPVRLANNAGAAAGGGGFWALLDEPVNSLGDNRWTYPFTEAEKTSAGYGGWTRMTDGRSGTAYNAIEEANSNTSGTREGNGVDPANLDTAEYTFSLQSLQPDTPVWIHEVTVQTSGEDGAELTTEYWILPIPNGVDGTCD